LHAVRRRQVIAGLDERVDAVRVAARDLDRDLADRRLRQTALGETLPGGAAVDRFEETAAAAAARAAPRVDLDLPHAGEQRARVARVDREVRAAGVLVDEEHALPRAAAVDRAIHAAIRLRPVRVAERAGEHD